MTPAKAKHTLTEASKYLASEYGFRANAAITVLKDAYGRVVQAAKGKMIGVYRQHQPTMFSPCMLAPLNGFTLCPVCSEHAPTSDGRPCKCQECRRGKVLCSRAHPAEPAFEVPYKVALTMINHGLAGFINDYKAIRLTFSKIAQLRDQSLKITEQVLIAYADDSLFESSNWERGKRSVRARAAVDLWDGLALAGGAKCERITEWTPQQLEASREQIQRFT